jgi:Flp pilus assembly protein TadG
MFGERGGAAVEAAIVTPLVMALFFGIIEMGFLFKDYIAVAGAVRSGVRIASANPRTSTFAQVAANEVALAGGAMNLNDVQQLWVYKAGATGLPDSGSFASCTVCVKFSWNAGTKAFVPTGPTTWPASSQNACSIANGGPPDRIGVYLQLKHNGFTKLVFTSINLADASILTLEPMPFLSGCK